MPLHRARPGPAPTPAPLTKWQVSSAGRPGLSPPRPLALTISRKITAPEKVRKISRPEGSVTRAGGL